MNEHEITHTPKVGPVKEPSDGMNPKHDQGIIERISVTATIEVMQDTAKVSVKRTEGESLSPYARDLQTVMMLVISKALKDFGGGIYVQPDEEDKS